jgi:hypothetical protein
MRERSPVSNRSHYEDVCRRVLPVEGDELRVEFRVPVRELRRPLEKHLGDDGEKLGGARHSVEIEVACPARRVAPLPPPLGE